MRALARLGAVGLAGTLLYLGGMLDAEVIRRPSGPTAVVVVCVMAAALALLVLAAGGRGRGEAAVGESRRARRILRVTWIGVSLGSLLGLAWVLATPVPALGDRTAFHNDAIAIDECAARLVARGRDPYTDFDLIRCYRLLGIGSDRTTPLRRGVLADLDRYPSDEALERAWLARQGGPGSSAVEFVGRPSYPALSFLLPAPFARLGWDPNLLSFLFLAGAIVAVVMRIAPGLRPFALTALIGAPCLTAFTIGGSADPLYALPLILAWLWRERSWSGLALGAACAVKQLAWPFVPFYLIAVFTEQGWRAVRDRVVAAAAVFAAVNAPFVLHDAGAWLTGITTPFFSPMFPLGAGPTLLFMNGVVPGVSPAVLYGVTVLAEIACLAAAWRLRRSSPELGLVLALVPLFFAPRSLFSYFFLLPLFAAAAIARLPLGDASPAAIRRSGAVTLLARPAVS